MNPAFSPVNYAILLLYLGAMVLIGWRFAGRQRTTEDYFLAGRNMPWLPVAMSMYASLTSAITFLGLPGMAYAENVSMIIVCIVSPVLAPFLILLFYPFYRRLKVTTSYEYINLRFGTNARRAVSILFLLARLGWMGTVIYAPAMALTVVTGIPLWLTILLMGVLATLYTVLGGMAAVLWTDVAQFVILIGGAIWIAITIVHGMPDGIAGIMAIAAEGGHLAVADWRITLTGMSIYTVALSFFFKMMQDYGTDQITVQRLMAVKSYRGMVKAVIFNSFTDFFIVALLLFIGIGLFAFYQTFPEALAEGLASDRILPYYIMHELPLGLSGLLIAAIFAAAMSSMDSGINSMTTVVLNDLVSPVRRQPVTSERAVLEARLLTLLLGGVATALAFYASTLAHIVKAFATFMSLFSAPVLALFLMGMFSRHTTFSAWLIGCAVGVPATWWVQNKTDVHWVYYFPLAFVLTLGTGMVVSWLRPGPPAPRELTLAGRRDLGTLS